MKIVYVTKKRGMIIDYYYPGRVIELDEEDLRDEYFKIWYFSDFPEISTA